MRAAIMLWAMGLVGLRPAPTRWPAKRKAPATEEAGAVAPRVTNRIRGDSKDAFLYKHETDRVGKSPSYEDAFLP